MTGYIDVSVFSALKKWLAPYTLQLSIVFIITFFATLLLIFGPLATPFLIDKIILNPSLSASDKTHQLLQYTALFALILIVGESARSVCAYWLEVINAKWIFHLRRQLFNILIHLPLPQLRQQRLGGIVGRVIHDTEGLNGILNLVILTPGVALLRVALGVVVLFVLNWRLAILAALIVPPMVLASGYSVFRVAPLFKRIESYRSLAASLVSETFSNIRLVRSVGKEGFESLRFYRRIKPILKTSIVAKRRQIPMSLAWTLLPMVAGLCMIGIGGVMVANGYASIGQVITFQLYTVLILEPINTVVNFLGRAQSGIACIQRASETASWVSMGVNTRIGKNLPFPQKIASIRFEGVFFSHDNGTPVLHNVTAALPVGKKTVLVGKSGAGKSTLADLLVRFFDPTRGQIYLNDTPISDFSVADYRTHVVVVQQDVMLFDASVRDNIAYAKPNATDAEVEEAAKLANAHDFIMALPGQYDTQIGEHGQLLSGGQRQRLSIARAYLCNPQLLILDEAANHLDVESEEVIQGALDQLMVGRTTLVIGHKPSTIVGADLILFIEDGMISESGTHHELMALKGNYFDRFGRQLRLNTVV